MKHSLVPLGLIHPIPPPREAPGVECGFSLEGGLLGVEFRVQGTQSLHLLHGLEGPGPHWGLWEGDVVEVFVRTGGSEYYEFIVSPLDQTFELKILEPRKRTDRTFRSGFRHEASRSQDGWSARMEIDLRALGWGGRTEEISGNAFAILGAPDARCYYSLFLPPQEVPDYHLPEHFAPLPGVGRGRVSCPR